MPGGDRTGPMGFGPMTGRAAGYCAGYAAPGYMNPVPGRGFGMGFGRGRGRGRWFGASAGMPYGMASPAASYAYGPAATPTPEQESAALKQQADYFEGMLADLRARLAELERQGGTAE